MANMNVVYQRPDPNVTALTNELRAHYGNPARTYEFVTGYKSPSNFSGHNPDSNGIVHAVDIFTDDNGNIPQAEGRALAERLRLVGAATNRFSYLIHDMSAGAPQPMIAGQFNGWVWQAYGGADTHSDHIHVSVADVYWGDPCPVPGSVTNNSSRWGVTGGTIKPQGGTTTPIQEDDMPTLKEIFDYPIQRKGGRGGTTTLAQTLAYLDSNIDGIPGGVLDKPVPRRGGRAGATTLGATVAFLDANLDGIKASSGVDAIVAAIPESLAQQVVDALGSKLAAK